MIKAGTATEKACPICGDEHRSYLFVVRGLPICQCPGCGLVMLSPQPSPSDFDTFYNYSPVLTVNGQPLAVDGSGSRLQCADSETERDAARRYVQALKNRGVEKGRVLLIAPLGHPFASEAKSSGYDTVQHLSIRELEEGILERHDGFDAVVVCHQLEKAADAAETIGRIKDAIRPGGVLLLTTPSIASWPRNFLGDQWTEWRPENRFYFSPDTIQSILLKNGFAKVWVTPDRRQYSLRHIYRRALTMPQTLLTRAVRLLYRLTPGPFRDMTMRFACSGMIVSATREAQRSRPLCSIVLPAYNEKNTIAELMKGLLAKQIPGADKEIIIVESNSKDGTRELVEEYRSHPEVRIVLQEKPRGKGNAVRAGFEHALGDILMIQDADLEYDLNDYDALVEPILNYRAAFVLGARHGGSWKMRKFNDNSGLATYLNIGHVFFTQLVNTLYRQRMGDPFTMYKVLRRDCLYGLTFECNRFDFDFELVIKLVRKGYTPLELPVNYRSRSFKEGKKVRMFRDPISWIWASFKYRFVKISKPPH